MSSEINDKIASYLDKARRIRNEAGFAKHKEMFGGLCTLAQMIQAEDHSNLAGENEKLQADILETEKNSNERWQSLKDFCIEREREDSIIYFAYKHIIDKMEELEKE